jgi:Lon protease-like protein
MAESALLPLFPLEVVLLPGAPLPLHIFEPRYKLMIGEAIERGSEFGVVLVHNGNLAAAGCTAVVDRVVKRYDDGRLDIVTRGLRRFRALGLDQELPYLRAEVEYFEDEPDLPADRDEAERLYALAGRAAELANASAPAELDPDDPNPSFRAAAELPLDLAFKQQLLTLRSERERLARLTAYLQAWIEKTGKAVAMKTLAARNGHNH